MNAPLYALNAPQIAARTQAGLLLDVDGVLLDWFGGFIRYASHRLGLHLDVTTVADYNLALWLKVDDATCNQMIQDFHDDDGGFFATLTPLPGAVEALHRAHAAGRTLDVITACSTLPHIVRARRDNLIKVFGDIFQEIHCVDLNGSKEDLLRSYSQRLWVEDKYENAILGAACGHDAFLLKGPQNARHHANDHAHPITLVDGWGCIQEHAALAA